MTDTRDQAIILSSTPEEEDEDSEAQKTAVRRTRGLRETFRERIRVRSWNGTQLDRQNLLEIRHRSAPVPGVIIPPTPLPFSPKLSTLDADFHIAQMVHEAMSCPVHKQSILALRGEAAADTLQLMQKMLDDPETYDMVEHRHTLRRLLIRLSQNSHCLPNSLFLQGVECCDREPTGGGSFADIYQASLRGKGVALKRLRVFQVSMYLKSDLNSALYREALVWRQLKHPNTLPFLGIDRGTFRPFLCMVSPWMANGSIVECMKHLRKIKADIPREYWLLEIARGLAYLHLEKVIHGDLRGANIMIDEDLHIRLADFGLALLSDAGSSSMGSDGGGGTRWTAPEVLNGLRPNCESDVYAFGCVCIEVYTMRPPFPHLKDAQVIARVIQGARPRKPAGDVRMQNYVWDLASRCWAKEPSSRPPIDVIVEYLSRGGQSSPSPDTPLKSSNSEPVSRRVFAEKQEVILGSEVLQFKPGHSSNPSASSSATFASSTPSAASSSPFAVHSPALSFSSDSIFESFVRSPNHDASFALPA